MKMIEGISYCSKSEDTHHHHYYYRTGILLLILTCSSSTNSSSSSSSSTNLQFNIILPEICHLPATVRLNFSWIQEMVHLGIRDETSRISLHIQGPEEICDGSEGLLKFITLAYGSDSIGRTMIGSLEPHFCPTAASASQLRQKQFISWTCPNIPGVISLKPENSDVVGAVESLVSYFNWKKIAFVKSRGDQSSFCTELGIEIQEYYYHQQPDQNVSLVILGNYEDLDQFQVYASIGTSIDNLFYCISYNYGLSEDTDSPYTRRGTGGSSWVIQRPATLFGRLPLVLLPEWPIPIDLFSPDGSTLGLITNPHPFPSTSYEIYKPRSNWDLESRTGNDLSPTPLTQIVEKLLAQMIFRSVKVGVEVERGQLGQRIWNNPSGTPSTTEHGNIYSNPITGQYSGSFKPSFYFSLAQYEKGRWHPLINLSNGDKPPIGRPKPTNTDRDRLKPRPSSTSGASNSRELTSMEVLTWVQILVALLVLILIIFSVIGLLLYARNRSQDFSFYGSFQRKMTRRHRAQGPYKILLTSNDIVFGSLGLGLGNDGVVVSNNGRKNSKSPFNNIGGGRGGDIVGLPPPPEEKPDLLKVPFSGVLRKNSASSNLTKADSVSFPGDKKARYKGDLVHLRKFGGSLEALTIKMKTMTVLENLNGLRHENIVAMLGCLTEPRAALVWEYCSRGSLYEILQQNDIKLDWAFKLSLLTDLVRGMRYLHLSLVKVHGNLTSHNCVVDARWVLKITDYGILGLYSAQGLSPIHKKPKDLLWTAPELLRDETLRKSGTQAADVYSFAIIMQEVLVRGEPYCMVTLTPTEIIGKLKHPPPLIRPSVSKGAAPPEAINIMRQCWAELPDMRPDFIVIHDLFKTLNHGRKANIVDTMFQMLEKYSNNLEELIRERTEQLDLEKKKTEQLLNRMLPSMVADKLKLGLPVDPEEFSEVTIYFSDIVGFTTISAYSTPFEVVDLLNDLYTCFDATINDYNVYKVETIGDAYMVVGGAPVWSKDHADQIATMALDLLHQSGKFRIRHVPFTPLRLRIGLHTGSCCAGVVGLTMPRYCLFGDTVNTASRMESTGSAWRIHISGETKAKLDSIGGYIIQYRGMTAIKGKGQMPTFWLLGKEGFDKELPKPPAQNDLGCLDEKAIMYGRTGIWPDAAEIGNEFADTTRNGSNVPTEAELSPHQRNVLPSNTGTVAVPLPILATPKYALLNSGGGGAAGVEPIRSLSPAEQVAHQLLNGKPAVRGLRRQFSLDQGTAVHPLEGKMLFRKAPSLEESSEYIYSNSCSGSFDRERGGSMSYTRERMSTGTGNLSQSIPSPVTSSMIKIEPQIIELPETQTSTLSDQISSTDTPSTPTVKEPSARQILKTRTLTTLEESPIFQRKFLMTKNNSAQD